MKTSAVNILVDLCTMSGTFTTHATVFTCCGIVTGIASKYGKFEIQYKSTRTGNHMESIWVYDSHTYLLGPILKAIEAGKKYGTEYMLVIEKRGASDTVSQALSKSNALIAMTQK
ncbi:hypothetical protein [Pseudoalteromonas luteoviolacea]|uniref:Uncharacterized protein n=1 Tax=Pseudoalteromonas luteoviolacea H33 TaxID=1365251 RepID=A0A167CXU5_9GAMM|nr:hypothetical protein [Pseudoalteromonas luteoviolacea]KZN48187.1 hypothetical protein N476_22295 [Pseudoalteromonas luteoviolacea H33]KZN78201.1 hypothetical protein N477_10070 [Pseudoalteromonas luteoviolacea H33-S]MBQ4876648.1 hypothetical protein [Pseudoalteromonas luteoviolacea]MBQ4905563.1 hypothetical protein [Pseudoalteromonas luteoviolacea]